jgi:hypothetical protein
VGIAFALSFPTPAGRGLAELYAAPDPLTETVARAAALVEQAGENPGLSTKPSKPSPLLWSICTRPPPAHRRTVPHRAGPGLL